MVIENVPRPLPSSADVIAAGIGPWDAIIGEGNNKVMPKSFGAEADGDY
jgi:hypothetical protein